MGLWQQQKRNFILITFDPHHHFSHHHFDYNGVQMWKWDRELSPPPPSPLSSSSSKCADSPQVFMVSVSASLLHHPILCPPVPILTNLKALRSPTSEVAKKYNFFKDCDLQQCWLLMFPCGFTDPQQVPGWYIPLPLFPAFFIIPNSQPFWHLVLWSLGNVVPLFSSP